MAGSSNSNPDHRKKLKTLQDKVQNLERTNEVQNKLLFDLKEGQKQFLSIIENLTASSAQSNKNRSAYRDNPIFDVIFDRSPLAFLIVNDEEKVIGWNKKTESLFQMEHDDLNMRAVKDLYPEKDWLIVKSFQIRQETHHDFQTKMVRKDGSVMDVELTLVHLRDSAGEQACSVCMIRDVTQDKRIQAEKKAREEAESATQAKSDFLASMTHEIRTPMNGILGMLQLLADLELSDEQREYVSTAKSSASALLKIINNILDFSKAEAGKLTLEQAPFELHSLLGETVASLALQTEERGIELGIHIEPEVPNYLVGDSSRLRQVIVNLIGNSVKFTEAGEVVLKVSLHKLNEEDVLLDFAVMDTGIGIPKEKQSSVFASFEQADQSTSRRYGGTGLGLSISLNIVKLMGGKIEVASPCPELESDLGGPGSKFYFTSVFRLDKEPQGKDEDLSLKDKKILIVDDNKTQRKILQDICEQRLMEATVVSDGEQALGLLKKENSIIFDFALIDANMPDLDGFTLVRKMQKKASCEKTKIHILVSNANSQEMRKCQELGVEGYIRKPLYASKVLDAITGRVKSQGPGTGKIGEGLAIKRSLSILVVEDNPVNQMVTTRLLDKVGHKTMVAEDGRAVFEKLGEETFDLILMDVQLPDMDGYEITKMIRELEKIAGIHKPIIAMTANALKGDKEKCLAAGMDDYLSKPVEPAELFATIEKWSKEADEESEDVDESYFVESNFGDEEEETHQKDELAEESQTDSEVKKNEGMTSEHQKDENMAENKDVAQVESTDGSVLNTEVGLSHTGGLEDLYCDILKVFVEDAPKRIEKIDEGVEKGDFKTIRIESHGLKGAAANVGGEQVREISYRIEKASEAQDMKSVEQELPQLKERLEILIKHAERMMESSHG